MQYNNFICELFRIPFSVFFFRDRDLRTNILFGKLISENKGRLIDEKNMKFEGKGLTELTMRLFNACWYMMVYCYNSGFDPKTTIETLLDEINLPTVTYENVKQCFDKNVIDGFDISSIFVSTDTLNH